MAGRPTANLAILKLLARTKLTLGDWGGAQAVADVIRRNGDEESLADQITGAIQAGKKNYDESISTFKRAYESSPDQVRPIVGLVRAYLLAGKVKDASSFLDAVLSVNPDNFTALVLRGQIYAQEGNTQSAADTYQKLINLEADNPLGYYQLAILQARTKELDKAEATLKQGLEKIPDNFLLNLSRANMQELSGNFERAIATYEELLDKRPDSEIVANNLASLLSEYRTDEVSLNRSYALSQRFKQSDVPQFKDTFGWASHKVGKFADAGSLLENAVDELPGMPIFHYHLGMNHLARDDKEAARVELERALQLAGDQSFSQADAIRQVLKDL
jgi:tetratricopeptide (TPR) repeat protein